MNSSARVTQSLLGWHWALALAPALGLAGCGGKPTSETTTGTQAAVPQEYVKAQDEMVDFLKSQAKKGTPRRGGSAKVP